MDKLKNIKIEYKDGSLSELIPIGAKASNVELENGHTVEYELSKAADDINTFEEKINKKPYYFNSIADMKAAEYLKEGDMTITLGYYEASDGGGANYLIRTKIQSDAEDNGSIHFIGQNLVAELIFDEPKKINVLQFGIKRNVEEDQSTRLNSILSSFNMKYIIYFPSGSYYFEDSIVNNNRHDLMGACNTINDFDRSINHSRLIFKNIDDNTILVDCYNGSRCTIRDLYIVSDAYSLSLDKTLMSNGTEPKNIFTETKTKNNITGLRFGPFGNLIENVSIYGCNLGIDGNTYNDFINIGIINCELGMKILADNVLTNIKCQKCKNGIEIVNGLNQLSQIRMDSIMEYGIKFNYASAHNNITNLIVDIAQYGAIYMSSANCNYIHGNIGRTGTYYAGFTPSESVEPSKACKVYLGNGSSNNKIHIIADYTTALDNNDPTRKVSCYDVVSSGNSQNNNIEITGKFNDDNISGVTLLTVDQISQLYHLDTTSISGSYSGNVKYRGIEYIITNTGSLNENNIKVNKPVDYNNAIVQSNNTSILCNSKVLSNVGEIRIGNNTKGWVTIGITESGNIKVQKLSTSYKYSDVQIVGVDTPTASNSATNKSYVDSK